MQVFKSGGASVKDADGVKNVAEVLKQFPSQKISVVISAMGKTTNALERLAKAYFYTALWSCRIFGVEPSILLHPLDFLGGEDVPRLKFFPSMKMSSKEKINIVEHCLNNLTNLFDVKTVGEHAAIVTDRQNLIHVTPSNPS